MAGMIHSVKCKQETELMTFRTSHVVAAQWNSPHCCHVPMIVGPCDAGESVPPYAPTGIEPVPAKTIESEVRSLHIAQALICLN